MTAPAYGTLLRNFNNNVALGLIPDSNSDILFGFNLDIDPGSAPEDVWSVGGIYTGQPLNTPEIVRLTSASAADNQAGIGATAYVLFGLKTNLSTAVEFELILAHPTDGTLPVTTAEAWFRVTRVFVIGVGSAGTAQGVITIQQNVTTANVFGQIPLGFNRSQMAVYTVPAQRSLGVNNGIISLGRDTGVVGHALISGNVRPPGGAYQSVFTFSVTDGAPIPFSFEYAGPVPAGSDIKFTVHNVSDVNSVVSISMNFLLNK